MSKTFLGQVYFVSGLLFVISAVIQLVSIFVGSFTSDNPFKPYMDMSLYLFVMSLGLHLISGYFLRCPFCGKCLTIQGFEKTHANAEHIHTWDKFMLLWYSGKVVCWHCGEEMSTKTL